MSRLKILASVILASAMLATQAAAAQAAPSGQDGTPTAPISGTVQSITVETEATSGTTTVVVIITDETGATQTMRLSLETAIALGLVTTDEAGNTVVNEAAIGQTVQIDPTTIIVDEEEAQHPVAAALSEFFSETLGVDYETVMGYHEEGVGFGVMTQALWMSYQMEGNAEMFSAIIEAKKSGDFSGITLPDGSTEENWGQLNKAVRQQAETEEKTNLGAVMSGHADNGQADDNQAQSKSNGKDKNEDKGKNK